MQRSAWKWIYLVCLGLASTSFAACADEGVGDPCTPETVPIDKQGRYGFAKTESYIESSSVQCRSRLCIVHRLDNGTEDIPADPRERLDGSGRCLADPSRRVPGCVSDDSLAKSVYCTCKCGGPKTAEQCDCPSGFTCAEILTLGGDGIKGSYCVKK